MARPALPKNKALSRQVAVRFRESDYRRLQRFRIDAIRAGKLGRGASFSDAVRLALESYLGGETATVDGPDRLAFTSGRPRAGRMDTRAVAKRIVKRVREA